MSGPNPTSPTPRFTSLDDQLHPIGDPALDWTETSWWSFHVAERGLAGWLYTQVKENVGVCAGGAFVYGPDGLLPWELPYYAWQQHQPLPSPLDLRDVTFRTGVSQRVIEPGMSYELGYRFREQQDFVAELRFDGLTEPIPHLGGAPPFTDSSHYDQHGRVTGTIWLHGEEIAVDCFSVRDRSWGRRPEHIGTGRRLSYIFGTVSPEEMFLVFCLPRWGDDDELVEHLSSGYLVRDGVLRQLVEATRQNERDQATAAVTSVRVGALDTDGRRLNVEAEPVAQMIVSSSGATINSFVRLDVDGRLGWGEDQDVWSMARLRDWRRGSHSAVEKSN
ncbi:MAG: DUF7065 domain-containing protein [Acidimicrobiales bacterium]